MHSINPLAQDDVVVPTKCKIKLWNIVTQFLVIRHSHVRQGNYDITLFLLLENLTFVTSKCDKIDVFKLSLVVFSQEGQPVLFSYSEDTNSNSILLNHNVLACIS